MYVVLLTLDQFMSVHYILYGSILFCYGYLPVFMNIYVIIVFNVVEMRGAE